MAQAADNQSYSPAWPEAKPGPIVDTPDWSDYRVYPPAARRANQEGRVTAELLVGPDGKPQQCRILITSFFSELDTGTCDVMLQMRFTPARDLRGNAVPSHFIRRVNWRLTDPMRFGSAFLRAHVTLEGGRLRDCEVAEAAGPYLSLWMAATCAILSDTPYYFGTRQSGDASVEFRLDADDQATFPQTALDPRECSCPERVRFTISASGDASQCIPEEQRGFGARGLNNMSPCGRLLSILWFEAPVQKAPQRTGIFETRVFFDDAKL